MCDLNIKDGARARQKLAGSFQNRKLGALHVKFNEIHAVDFFFSNPIVERSDSNGYRRGWLWHIRRPEAVVAGVVLVHDVQVSSGFLTSEGQRLNDDVVTRIDSEIQAQGASFAGRGLKRENAARRSDPPGSEERVKALMRADVKNCHPR